MEARTTVEDAMVTSLVALFGSNQLPIVGRAHAFATYVVPSKEFVNFQEIIDVAEYLVDKLEAEISIIRASDDPDREPKLVAARAYKKEIRGFLVYDRKHA